MYVKVKVSSHLTAAGASPWWCQWTTDDGRESGADSVRRGKRQPYFFDTRARNTPCAKTTLPLLMTLRIAVTANTLTNDWTEHPRRANSTFGTYRHACYSTQDRLLSARACKRDGGI
jgi:hypothetical protein